MRHELVNVRLQLACRGIFPWAGYLQRFKVEFGEAEAIPDITDDAVLEQWLRGLSRERRSALCRFFHALGYRPEPVGEHGTGALPDCCCALCDPLGNRITAQKIRRGAPLH